MMEIRRFKDYDHFDNKLGHKRTNKEVHDYNFNRLNLEKKIPKLKPDKDQLRKEIDAATVEYLKNNEITHLPSMPDIRGYSVKVKDLREISDTEEFYYLEEQNEEW